MCVCRLVWWQAPALVCVCMYVCVLVTSVLVRLGEGPSMSVSAIEFEGLDLECRVFSVCSRVRGSVFLVCNHPSKVLWHLGTFWGIAHSLRFCKKQHSHRHTYITHTDVVLAFAVLMSLPSLEKREKHFDEPMKGNFSS